MRRLAKLGLFLIVAVVSFFLSYQIIPAMQPFGMPLDVDYIQEGEYEGNFLVTDGRGSVVIVTPQNTVVWRCGLSEFFVHDADMLPNGNVMIADTLGDRVFEVDINDPTQIVWEWNARDHSDINWTDFGISNGWNASALEVVKNQSISEHLWTHLNDVDFINGSYYGKSYNSVLISLCHFDMVVEVNYSSSKEIVWSYGEPGKEALINDQHNPDMLPNGNVVICDSLRGRVIEVDYDTKEVVWDYTSDGPEGPLWWNRDCDYVNDSLYLMTDSNNRRLLLVNRNTMAVERIYQSFSLVQPYEADLVEIDGQMLILVGDPVFNVVTFIDFETGLYIGALGFPSNPLFPYAVLSFGLIVNVNSFVRGIQREDQYEGLHKLRRRFIFLPLISIVIIVIIMVMLPAWWNSLMRGFGRWLVSIVVGT